MHMYCKNCKNTGNMVPKKLIRIFKNKTKRKSKCIICLIERTFIHKIESKFDLESELQIYLQFFMTHVTKEHGDLLHEV